MLDKLTQRLELHGNALLLRSERQRTSASNIANADTPGYVARDFRFAEAMRAVADQQAAAASPQRAASTTHAQHMPLPAAIGELGSRTSTLAYARQSQPSLDNNSVDMDRERAAFVDNAVRYEATLRFINGQSRTMLSAIQGQ